MLHFFFVLFGLIWAKCGSTFVLANHSTNSVVIKTSLKAYAALRKASMRNVRVKLSIVGSGVWNVCIYIRRESNFRSSTLS